jgi:hypothetical protein
MEAIPGACKRIGTPSSDTSFTLHVDIVQFMEPVIFGTVFLGVKIIGTMTSFCMP